METSGKPNRDGNGERARLFAAIPVPENIRQILETLQRSLKERFEHAREIRWVRPQQIHLTLSFLGSVPRNDIPALESALGSAASSAQPLALRLAGVGAFPNTRSPRVVWVGLRGDMDSLLQLQKAAGDACHPFAEKPDDKKFHPHLTLARVKGRVRKAADILNSLTELETEESWTARDIHLVESRLSPDGAEHITLQTFPFEGVAGGSST